MRSREDFDSVLGLVAEGLNDCEVSRLTAVPRSTVRDWRQGLRGTAPRSSSGSDYGCCERHDFSAVPTDAYAYLLGLYLGDGYIAPSRRGVWRLRISMDARYPGIINECAVAMERILPGKRAHKLRRPSQCVEISMYWKHWPCLFPQAGPGRKHERLIRLEEWQEVLLEHEAERLLRGLIHSDGCRIIANDRGVHSVRYHFSNRSEDIKQIFCAALDVLGIPWTRPCDRQIAVYRKTASALMDEFIGPKY